MSSCPLRPLYNTVSIPMTVSVTIKVYYCVNGNGLSSGQIGFGTYTRLDLCISIGTIINFDGDGNGCVNRPLLADS